MSEAEEFEFRLRLEREGASTPAPAAPKADTRPPLMAAMQDLAAGALRGAGSIGATLLATPQQLREDITGSGPGSSARRADMTSALGGLGVNTDSTAFGAGKLGGEIAGTAGVGGVLANTVGRVAPALAAKVPNLLQAIRTAGMTGGGGNAMSNALMRALGGGITGGASAGLVDPGQAGTGAAVGAALPVASKIAGAAGNLAGRVIGGPAQSADLAAAIREARKVGYVMPPSQANPTLANRMIEGLSGKITTAQNASAKNQAVTDDLAALALGLPRGTQITPAVVKSVQNTAGQAYEAIGQTGAITPGGSYGAALDAIDANAKKAAQGFPSAAPSPVIGLVASLRSPTFDAASAVAKIGELRSAADDAFRTGNTDVARASRAGAKALEDAIEVHLQQTGQSRLLQEFRDARTLYAKSFSVQKALNPTTGSIDAKKLAAELKKGKPLSGELKTAAEFAGRFPKAAQTPEGMGSLPGSSPLDWHAAAATSLVAGNPLPMAGVAVRPTARALALSPFIQNRLIQGQPNALQRLLMDPELQQLGYRAAPLMADGQ